MTIVMFLIILIAIAATVYSCMEVEKKIDKNEKKRLKKLQTAAKMRHAIMDRNAIIHADDKLGGK